MGDFVAAAVKLLQSCLTLCDPIDSSLPGSSVHGIFQAGILEWGAIAFSGETLLGLTKYMNKLADLVDYCKLLN